MFSGTSFRRTKRQQGYHRRQIYKRPGCVFQMADHRFPAGETIGFYAFESKTVPSEIPLRIHKIEGRTRRNPSDPGGLFRFFGVFPLGRLALGRGNEGFFILHRPLGAENNLAVKKSIFWHWGRTKLSH
jgi:hypothetical protein